MTLFQLEDMKKEFFFKDFEELCRCSDKIKETYTGCNQYKTESY